jgi:hypothetical protein
LAHGVTACELARIMGTSVTLIEAHHGALLDTARDAILERLDAIESALRQTGNEHEKSGRRSV